MNLIVYAVFYSLYSHQHVSAAIAAIFRVILLQQYKSTVVVSCVVYWLELVVRDVWMVGYTGCNWM